MAVFAMVADRWGWQRVSRQYWRVAEGPFGRLVSAIRRWPAASLDRWRHRAGRAHETVTGRPIKLWPALQSERWASRPSRRRSIP